MTQSEGPTHSVPARDEIGALALDATLPRTSCQVVALTRQRTWWPCGLPAYAAVYSGWDTSDGTASVVCCWAHLGQCNPEPGMVVAVPLAPVAA